MWLCWSVDRKSRAPWPFLTSALQYEHEVAQLKKLMGQLQRKLSLAETQLQQQLGADGWASGAAGEGDQQQRRQEKDLQMKSIITRCAVSAPRPRAVERVLGKVLLAAHSFTLLQFRDNRGSSRSPATATPRVQNGWPTAIILHSV